jgi:NADH-quinone oxidoreductase subunit N
MNTAGREAVVYFLSGYLFTVMAAFGVICAVMQAGEVEDISSLARLHQRSPLLAATMTLALVSLAGIPPLAGFFGKFLLLKAVAEAGPAYYWLMAVAIVGVVISLYYYFGVVRVIYWSREPADLTPIRVSLPCKLCLGVCVGGMLLLGVYPAGALKLASGAVVQVVVNR